MPKCSVEFMFTISNVVLVPESLQVGRVTELRVDQYGHTFALVECVTETGTTTEWHPEYRLEKAMGMDGLQESRRRCERNVDQLEMCLAAERTSLHNVCQWIAKATKDSGSTGDDNAETNG